MEKVRILIVEDETIVARDICNMIEGLGYSVVGIASNATEAIFLAGKENPSLVLMDIMLEGIQGGVEAADIIYKKHNSPVVYLTSYADQMTIQSAKKTSPFGYLLKPFEERELYSTIEIALYKFEMEQELKQREEWLSTILNSIGDGIIATNDSGEINFMNPVAELLTGWNIKKAMGSPIEKVFNIFHEKEKKDFKFQLNNLLNKKKCNISKEVILKTKKNEKMHIEFRSAPILGEKTKGIVFAFSNISQRIEAQKSLRKSLEKQKRIMREIVQAIAITIEKRDPYTAGHQKRVSKLALAIADQLNLKPDRKEGLQWAGELHDIGKIYIPAEILSKPGKITNVEYSIIQTHSRVGFDILKSVEFSWPIHKFVHEHHERIDGSGFPQGLKKNEISFEARILAVADVIEAMASHRPYRPALPMEMALDEIKKNKGILYDEKVVDACLFLFQNGKFQFE